MKIIRDKLSSWARGIGLFPVRAREYDYKHWLKRHSRSASQLTNLAAEIDALPYKPLLSIVTPLYNTEARWLRPFFASVLAQLYPRWELCIADDASADPQTMDVLAEYAVTPRIRVTRLASRSGISAASNAALAMAGGEFVVLMDSDDEIPPDAFCDIVRFLNDQPQSDFIYSDEDKLDEQGRRCEPYFKPDWSPELLHSYMYINHVMVLRRSLVVELGGFRDECAGSQDHDLALRVTAHTNRIHHIPRVLYHWRKTPGSAAARLGAKAIAEPAGRRALGDYFHAAACEAEVLPGLFPGLYRVRRRIRGFPLVTIIVPIGSWAKRTAKGEVSLLARTIRSVIEKTEYANVELLVAGAGEMPAALRASFADMGGACPSYVACDSADFARQANRGADLARGEHLLFLAAAFEVMTPEWLAAMLEYSQEQPIGAVGAKLHFSDGRLQHIGLYLGVTGIVGYPFQGHPGSAPGYGASAIVARNYAAVSGACLMTRRALFRELGGFDERFRTAWSDVDYCLRLGRAGYRVVYTPHAQLRWTRPNPPGWQKPRRAEIALFRATWGAPIESDPYYNPNLSRRFLDCRPKE